MTLQMGRWRGIAAVVTAVVAAAVIASGGVAAAHPSNPRPRALATPRSASPDLMALTPVPNPATDPFYAPPQSFSGGTPGQVLKSRPVTVAGLPDRAYQLQYVSTDTFGVKRADVATVVVPLLPSVPPRLVSYQTPIDSLSYNCDASYKLRKGTEPEVAEVGSLLVLGWTVVVPDFLGPDHQWTAGYVEARSTLDGIRAAENFAPAGLAGAGTPVGLTGYSGGARGAEFANELASRYAPELSIVGAAPGGLAVDVGDVMRHVNGGLFAGVYFAAFFGLGRAYPSIGVDKLLNARGLRLQRDISGMCIEQFIVTYAFQRIETYTVNAIDPLSLPRFTSVLDQIRGGRYGRPTAPTRLYIAGNDELIVPANDDELVRSYCANGLTVQYVKYPGEHVIAEQEGFPGVVAWLASRFAGRPAPSTC